MPNWQVLDRIEVPNPTYVSAGTWVAFPVALTDTHALVVRDDENMTVDLVKRDGDTIAVVDSTQVQTVFPAGLTIQPFICADAHSGWAGRLDDNHALILAELDDGIGGDYHLIGVHITRAGDSITDVDYFTIASVSGATWEYQSGLFGRPAITIGDADVAVVFTTVRHVPTDFRHRVTYDIAWDGSTGFTLSGPTSWARDDDPDWDKQVYTASLMHDGAVTAAAEHQASSDNVALYFTRSGTTWAHTGSDLTFFTGDNSNRRASARLAADTVAVAVEPSTAHQDLHVWIITNGAGLTAAGPLTLTSGFGGSGYLGVALTSLQDDAHGGLLWGDTDFTDATLKWTPFDLDPAAVETDALLSEAPTATDGWIRPRVDSLSSSYVLAVAEGDYDENFYQAFHHFILLGTGAEIPPLRLKQRDDELQWHGGIRIPLGNRPTSRQRGIRIPGPNSYT